jgi:hypothetical protein
MASGLPGDLHRYRDSITLSADARSRMFTVRIHPDEAAQLRGGMFVQVIVETDERCPCRWWRDALFSAMAKLVFVVTPRTGPSRREGRSRPANRPRSSKR